MGFLSNIFKKRKQAPQEALTSIAKEIESRVDGLANDLFSSYHEVLLGESIVYIVFAVWGAKKDGLITETQKEINAIVSPVVSEIRDILNIQESTRQQDYAIDYLVRSLLISKITFMIEHMKLHIASQTGNTHIPSKPSSAPDVLTDEWLSNMSITDSESWRRKYNGRGGSPR